MKGSTWILFLKAICYAGIGGLTPLTTGLAQWSDSGMWPPAINWVVIGAGCLVGAFTQLLSFFSQAFGDWKLGQPAKPDESPLDTARKAEAAKP